MEQQLFAVWKYDQFPYFLMGELQKVMPNGLVEVKGYSGIAFKPIMIIPKETGEEKKKKINALEEEYRQMQEKLRREYVEKANSILNSEC